MFLTAVRLVICSLGANMKYFCFTMHVYIVYISMKSIQILQIGTRVFNILLQRKAEARKDYELRKSQILRNKTIRVAQKQQRVSQLYIITLYYLGHILIYYH